MEKAELQAAVAACVEKARAENPMAPSITNNVTIDFVANAQLAAGGSAAMVYLPDEAEICARVGAAMYLNIGTLVPVLGESIPAAARTAHELGKPWVLDPVALGIGKLRTDIALACKEHRPSIVRGNASEVIALAKLWGLLDADEGSGPRGVDTTDEVEAALPAALAIARHTGGAVAVSGETDLVVGAGMVARSRGGSELFTRITGSGCSLGGVMAVYAGVADPFTAALAATNAYNAAGARAAAATSGPASFKVAFLDALYALSGADVAANPFDVQEA